jgi:hypothetical protein
MVNLDEKRRLMDPRVIEATLLLALWTKQKQHRAGWGLWGLESLKIL